MSQEQCLNFLKENPGKHSMLEIAEGTHSNLDSVRTYMRKLEVSGEVTKEKRKRANQYGLYEKVL